MSNSKVETSGGISLCSLVFVVFLTLKLAGIGAVAEWSWWWVTAPLWAPLAVVLTILGISTVVGLIVLGIIALINRIK